MQDHQDKLSMPPMEVAIEGKSGRDKRVTHRYRVKTSAVFFRLQC